ncbi:morphogenic membrane protein MmpA [Streptomyces sp. NPDC048604]
MTTPPQVAPAPLRRVERAMMSVLAVAAVLAGGWLLAMIYIVGAWVVAL